MTLRRERKGLMQNPSRLRDLVFKIPYCRVAHAPRNDGIKILLDIIRILSYHQNHEIVKTFLAVLGMAVRGVMHNHRCLAFACHHHQPF